MTTVVGGAVVAGVVVTGVVVSVAPAGSVAGAVVDDAAGAIDDVVTAVVSGAADPLGSPALPHAAATNTMASNAIVGLVMAFSGMGFGGMAATYSPVGRDAPLGEGT